jgi:hypothetical protein
VGWHSAESDPKSVLAVIVVEGRLLGFCVRFNEEDQLAEIDVALGKRDRSPSPLVKDDHNTITHRLNLQGALEIRRNGDASGTHGWRYWTGAHWIDEHSQRIAGPAPMLVTDKDGLE